ncbi:hypothetical protein AUP43_15990 [Oceanibaculum pacificum]|uniref:Uncharacterized protein n=1 Tax=Oceanibaculum pacificum TaxID=580166 RepID=A0A154WGB5_9PROT|nr:hypothetical protein AUP43_15990 [Oceanibaculum pacificum]
MRRGIANGIASGITSGGRCAGLGDIADRDGFRRIRRYGRHIGAARRLRLRALRSTGHIGQGGLPACRRLIGRRLSGLAALRRRFGNGPGRLAVGSGFGGVGIVRRHVLGLLLRRRLFGRSRRRLGRLLGGGAGFSGRLVGAARLLAGFCDDAPLRRRGVALDRFIGPLGIDAITVIGAPRGVAILLEAIRLRAIRLRAIRLRAIRLRAIRLRAIRLRAIRLRAIRLRAIRLRAIRLGTMLLGAMLLGTTRLGAAIVLAAVHRLLQVGVERALPTLARPAGSRRGGGVAVNAIDRWQVHGSHLTH